MHRASDEGARHNTRHETQHTRHNARDTTHETQRTRHNTRDTTHETQHTRQGTYRRAHETQKTPHKPQKLLYGLQHTTHITQHAGPAKHTLGLRHRRKTPTKKTQSQSHFRINRCCSIPGTSIQLRGTYRLQRESPTNLVRQKKRA